MGLFSLCRMQILGRLRYTYGKVATWNPINYYRNLLTYDIHEQIRSILISLRDLIIDMDESGWLNSDNVTVDLLYFYKPISCNEEHITDKGFESETSEIDRKEHDGIEDEPRLISSGDNDLENSPRVLCATGAPFIGMSEQERAAIVLPTTKTS